MRYAPVNLRSYSCYRLMYMPFRRRRVMKGLAWWLTRHPAPAWCPVSGCCLCAEKAPGRAIWISTNVGWYRSLMRLTIRLAARAYINPLTALLVLRRWPVAGQNIVLTAAGSSCASLLLSGRCKKGRVR